MSLQAGRQADPELCVFSGRQADGQTQNSVFLQAHTPRNMWLFRQGLGYAQQVRVANLEAYQEPCTPLWRSR
jgi:hypothetical protein